MKSDRARRSKPRTAAMTTGLTQRCSWTYTTTANHKATRSFVEEYHLLGEPLIEILDAAKRCGLHKAPSTVAGLQDGVKYLARAISAHARDAHDIADWEAALVSYLRTRRVVERTRHSVFAKTSPIFAEVARTRRQAHTVRVNPFSPIATRDTPYVESTTINAILKSAKADVLAFYRRFCSPPPEYGPFLAEAREIAANSHGCLPRYQFSDWTLRDPLGTQTLRLMNRARYNGIDTGLLRSLLCPQAMDLLPFFLLMTYALAANVESLANLRCDAIRPYDNPLTGRRLLITLDKPRAGGEIPPYQVSGDAGTLSVSWLIDAVSHMTSFARSHAADGKLRALLFLFSGNGGLFWFANGIRYATLKKYLAERGHPHIALNALRPTRLIDDFRKHKDVDRARVLARQKSVATTLLYLDHSLAREEDEALVARAQGELYTERAVPDTSSRARVKSPRSAATMPTHTCANPEDPNMPHDADGKCLSFTWPLNDRHFVMLLEPRPVAFLLRDYDALCEAQLRLPGVPSRRLTVPRSATSSSTTSRC